jgi:hypothetical protein
MKKVKTNNSLSSWKNRTLSNDAFLDSLEESRMIREGYNFDNMRKQVRLDPDLENTRYVYKSVEKAISTL